MIRESIIRDGGWFKVMGRSMFPTLMPGRSVKVEKVPLEDIQPGDIVLSENDQQFRVHRLVKLLEGGLFQTAGDFSRRADSPQELSHIVGRVAHHSLLNSLVKKITLWRFA